MWGKNSFDKISESVVSIYIYMGDEFTPCSTPQSQQRQMRLNYSDRYIFFYCIFYRKQPLYQMTRSRGHHHSVGIAWPFRVSIDQDAYQHVFVSDFLHIDKNLFFLFVPHTSAKIRKIKKCHKYWPTTFTNRYL